MRTRVLMIVIASGMCAVVGGCQAQKKEPTASVVAGAGSTEVEAAAPARADLPTLDAEQKTRAAREVEQYKKQTGFVQVDSVKGADSLAFMKGGFTQTPDGTASVGVAGVGATLKDAHDAAIVAAQRQMMRDGQIPAAKVVISQGAFRKLADGWQVFVQGQSGPGAVVKAVVKDESTKVAPVDLVDEK